MFILKTGHQPGVYVPLRALFLVIYELKCLYIIFDVKMLILKKMVLPYSNITNRCIQNDK